MRSSSFRSLRPLTNPVRSLGLLLVVGWLGCAGDYVARTRGVRQAYESNDYPRALSLLDGEAKGPELDRLLILMDRGMILHSAGKYEESVAVLAEADRLSQQLDVVSVSEEAKALLSNERQRAYRGFFPPRARRKSPTPGLGRGRDGATGATRAPAGSTLRS